MNWQRLSNFLLQVFRVYLFGNIFFFVVIRRSHNLLLTSRGCIILTGNRFFLEILSIRLSWPKFYFRIFLYFFKRAMCDDRGIRALKFRLFQIDTKQF